MLKKIPKYVYITYLIMIIMQFITYYLTQIINSNRTLFDFTIHAFDDKIPLISFFVVFYIMSYVYWAITPLIMSKESKKDFYNWAIATFFLYLITFIIYIIVPTTIKRPVVENNNIFDYLVNLIYQSDSPERPTNLFPSMHCSLSVMCYLGVYRKKEINKGYRIGTLILTILICLSTQFIKQHYIVDLISGVIIPIIIFIIVKYFNLSKYLLKNEVFNENEIFNENED